MNAQRRPKKERDEHSSMPIILQSLLLTGMCVFNWDIICNSMEFSWLREQPECLGFANYIALPYHRQNQIQDELNTTDERSQQLGRRFPRGKIKDNPKSRTNLRKFNFNVKSVLCYGSFIWETNKIFTRRTLQTFINNVCVD